MNGMDKFMKLRAQLLRQGEKDFEAEIASFPYGVIIPGLGKGLDDEAMREWLDQQFGSDYYIMPINAQGKYKDRWNWIYFKTKDQAMLFKLTWC